MPARESYSVFRMNNRGEKAYHKIGILSIWPLTPDAFGGTEKFIKDLSVALSTAGHNVELVSPAQNVPRYSDMIHRHLPIGKIGSEYMLRRSIEDNGLDRFYQNITDGIRSLTLKHKYTCLIINSPLLVPLYDLRIDKIVVIHDNPQELKNYFGLAISRKIIRRLRSSAHGNTTFVTPSKYYAENLNRAIKHDVEFIPHALTEAPPTATSHDGQPKNSLRILVPSRLEWHQKGQDLVIKALSRVKLPFELTLTGFNPIYKESKKYLQELSSKNKISEKVRIAHVSNMNKSLLKHNLIIIPSRFESFGYAAQWAIASGTRTILSDIPTFKEIARGAPNARFFRNGSPDSLRSAIQDYRKIKVERPPHTWFLRYSKDVWTKKYLSLLNN